MTSKEKKPREISDGARYALIGTIILEKIESQKISLHATQIAESRILFSTNTITSSPSFTLTETSTPEKPHTPTPSISLGSFPANPTFTLTPSVPTSGVKYCADTSSLNVRAGPGLNYAIMGGLLQDTCIFFDGRLEDLENKWG